MSELEYAKRLAIHLWERHYKADAPHWKPLPDLMGILTQIDNMVTGLAANNPAEKHSQISDETYAEAFARSLAFQDACDNGSDDCDD